VSIIASLLSTLTFLSTPGEMIRYGVGYFSGLFGFVLIIPIVSLIIIPVLMRLPASSIYDYLERRFSVSVRTLAAGIFVVMRLVWMGLILYTVSVALRELTAYEIPLLVLLMGGMVTFYTALGGMRAVLYSDCALFFLLFGCAVFIPAYVAWSTGVGPLNWWQVFSEAGRTKVPLFSWDPTVRISVVGTFLPFIVWSICTHGADQVAAQRYLSTPSPTVARRSLWICSICNIVMVLFLMLNGLSLFYFYYHQSHLPLAQFQVQIAAKADRVLAQFIGTQFRPGVMGLMLAGLLAGAMSSTSAGMNSISTVVITDFVQRWRRKPLASDLRLAKLLTVAAGAIAVSIALAVNEIMKVTQWNFLEMIERINHIFVAPLGALFFVGILSRRVGTPGAVIGFFCGASASVLVSFSKNIFGMTNGISFMWIMPTAFIVTAAVSLICSLIFQPPSEDQLSMVRGGKKRAQHKKEGHQTCVPE
jgi:SSS family solute:Na+ symporter